MRKLYKILIAVLTALVIPVIIYAGSAILPGGVVTVIHKNGTKTFYTPTSDTNLARGTALTTAVTAASCDDLFVLSSHIFDIGTPNDGVDMRKSVGCTFSIEGSGSTTIQGFVDTSIDSSGIIVMDAGTHLSNITIKCKTNGNDCSPIIPSDDSVIRNVHTIAFTDGILDYIGRKTATGTSTKIYNWICESGWNCSSLSTGKYDIYNYSGYASSNSIVNSYQNVSCMYNAGATINLYNFTCTALNGTVQNYGIVTSAGTTNFYSGNITTSGTNAKDLVQTGGTFNVWPDVSINISKLSGTIQYQSIRVDNVVAASTTVASTFPYASTTMVTATTASTTKLVVDGSITLGATRSLTSGVFNIQDSVSTRSFISNFGTNDTFVGDGSGNFTLTGSYNTGVGNGVLASLQGGQFNNAFGNAACAAVSSGSGNQCIGQNSGSSITSNPDNVFVGDAAGYNTPNPYGCVGIGKSAFRDTESGTCIYSTYIGFQAGYLNHGNLRGASAFGANATVNCSNCMVLGQATGTEAVNWVGIGTTTPNQNHTKSRLAVVGGVQASYFYATSTAVSTAGRTIYNTGSELSLFQGPWDARKIGANTLHLGTQICFDFKGSYTTPIGGATITARINVGTGLATTTLATKTTSALGSGATDLAFDGDGCVTVRSVGASGTMQGDGKLIYESAAGTSVINFLRGTQQTIDTTVDQYVDITAQWDVATVTRSATTTQSSLWVK